MSTWSEKHLVPRIGYPRPVMAERELVAVTDLPWMRRGRVDSNIRRAIGDLRALAVEDDTFASSYRAMAEAFDACVKLLDAIEDTQSRVGRVTL